MRRHLFVCPVEFLHVINSGDTLEIPLAVGKEINTSLAKARFVGNAPFVAVDCSDGFEIPEHVINGSGAVVMIAAYAEPSMRTHQISGHLQSVLRSGKFHDGRAAHGKKRGIVAVAAQVHLSHGIKGHYVFFGDGVRSENFGGSEAECIFQRLRPFVYSRDFPIAHGPEQGDHTQSHISAAYHGDRIAQCFDGQLHSSGKQAGQRLGNRILILQAVRHMNCFFRLHDDIFLKGSAAQPGNSVAGPEGFHAFSDLFNDPDRFMTQRIALFGSHPRIQLRMADA